MSNPRHLNGLNQLDLPKTVTTPQTQCTTGPLDNEEPGVPDLGPTACYLANTVVPWLHHADTQARL